METTVTGKPFSVSTTIKHGTNTAAYTSALLINSSPAVLGAVITGSMTVTLADSTGVVDGMTVVGSLGLTAGYTVASLDTAAHTFTVSAAATATSAAATLTFTATALPKFDLTGFADPGQTIEINEAIIKSSQGTASPKINPILTFYDTANPQATVADRTAFAPTQAVEIANSCGGIEDFPLQYASGATSAKSKAEEICRRIKVGEAREIYGALQDNNGYTMSAAETLTMVLKGIVHR